VTWSAELRRIFGFGPDTAVSVEVFLGHVHAGDRPNVEQRILEAVETTGSMDFEARIMRTDGQTRWVTVRGEAQTFDGEDGPRFAGTLQDITERKRLERDLHQISAAVANAMDGIAITDARERILYVNDARAGMHGYEQPANLVGEAFEVLFDESEHSRLTSVVAPALERDGRWHGEATGLRRDGTAFPMEISRTLLPDGHLVSVARDISRRREAEQALRQSEERYRRILSEITEGYFEVDLSGTFTFVNDSLCHLFGIPREELLGTNYRDYADVENAAEVYRRFHDVFETGRTDRGFDWRLRRSDGTERVVSSSVSLIRNTQEEPVGFRGITRDVTERHRIEQELRRSEERYRLVTRATQEIVWDRDLISNRTTWRGAVQAMLGYSEHDADVDSDWLRSRMHPEDRETVLSDVQGFYESDEEMWSAEFRLRRHDDHYIPVFVRGYAVRNEHGQAVRFVGSLMDISERKEHEEQLQAARDEAELANQAKSQFLANMSHEIRTPMNGVLGLAELLLDTDLDPVQRHYVETVHRSGAQLLAVINDILDLSKIEAGRMPIETADFEVVTVIEDATASIALSAARKGLEFERVIDPAVPPMVRGDSARICQVLTNLAGNAEKFTEEGRVQVRVELAEQAEKNECTVELLFVVEDSGIGLTAEERSRLFQSFSQADASTTRRYGGTGLGLAICKELVELMGGTLGVDTEPGVGSRFWFRLPLGRCDTGRLQRRDGDQDNHTGTMLSGGSTSLARTVEEAPAYRGGSDTPAGGAVRRRVLLVEDSPVNQLVAKGMLHRLGYSVDVAGNGVEALDLLCTRQRYAAILMDVQMPVMDGYETAAAIRAREARAAADGEEQKRFRTPIIAMTANALTGDREKALGAGMDDYLSKPYTRKKLETVLERWVGAGRRHDRETIAGKKLRRHDRAHAGALDHEVLAQLRQLGQKAGRNLLETLVPVFLKDAHAQVSALHEALLTDDADEVASIAHRLRGSSANLGAHRIADTCSKLETLAETGQLMDGFGLVHTLATELATVRSHLEEELANTGPK
jgi:PAS domain S-box-containing protein